MDGWTLKENYFQKKKKKNSKRKLIINCQVRCHIISVEKKLKTKLETLPLLLYIMIMGSKCISNLIEINDVKLFRRHNNWIANKNHNKELSVPTT